MVSFFPVFNHLISYLLVLKLRTVREQLLSRRITMIWRYFTDKKCDLKRYATHPGVTSSLSLNSFSLRVKDVLLQKYYVLRVKDCFTHHYSFSLTENTAKLLFHVI
jgi:hypothetical protein